VATKYFPNFTMARSQEKAMSMLNRWVDQRRGVESGLLSQQRVARFPGECRTVKEGEIARSQILRELGSSISQIQNTSLGEMRIRELNDTINRLLRSKYAWEMQIKQLGGPDYSKIGMTVSESDGVEIPGQGGYRYFGAAKNLPGVREALTAEVTESSQARKTRKQLLKNIKPDYYGWRDEDDPELLVEEMLVEASAIESLIQNQEGQSIVGRTESPTRNDAIPLDIDTNEFDQLLLQKRKEMLLAKYIKPKQQRADLSQYHEQHVQHGGGEVPATVRMIE
jgi:pre-mRNA-splicing factor ISY1